LIWLTFTPQAGREQAGRRPGLVLSPRSYNAKVELCLVCPVTQHAKGTPGPLILKREGCHSWHPPMQINPTQGKLL
jgi:mRNA interferase MazF